MEEILLKVASGDQSEKYCSTPALSDDRWGHLSDCYEIEKKEWVNL